MSDLMYVKEFLNQMYADGVVASKIETIRGTEVHTHTVTDSFDQIEMTAWIEDGKDVFVVTGYRFGNLGEGVVEETELIATNDSDAALATFERAVESVSVSE